MSVVAVLWALLAVGFGVTGIAAIIAWRRRMRESLPSPEVARQHYNEDGERHDAVADHGISTAVPRTPRAA